MQIKYLSVFFAINCFFLSSAHVAAADKFCNLSSSTGVRLESYEYRETDSNNRLIDKEDGLLPGLQMGLAVKCDQWELAANGSLQHARLEYDGQTNTGAKFLTRTEEKIRELSAQIGRRFFSAGANSIGVYAGLGEWSWQRNIASRSNVSGLDETYRWRYYFLGGNVALVEKNPHQLLFDIRWLHRTQAKLSVDFRGIFDKPEDLSLNVQNGWRLALPWRYVLDNSNIMHIEPYAESWHIDRTGSKSISRNGLQIGNFFEPASNTKLYGVTLNWLYHF
jgi:hypothetical protein